MTEDQIKAAQTLLRDIEHLRYSKQKWDGIQVDGLLAMMGIHAKPETRELAQGFIAGMRTLLARDLKELEAKLAAL
jgi:hypothetical protein